MIPHTRGVFKARKGFDTASGFFKARKGFDIACKRVFKARKGFDTAYKRVFKARKGFDTAYKGWGRGVSAPFYFGFSRVSS